MSIKDLSGERFLNANRVTSQVVGDDLGDNLLAKLANARKQVNDEQAMQARAQASTQAQNRTGSTSMLKQSLPEQSLRGQPGRAASYPELHRDLSIHADIRKREEAKAKLNTNTEAPAQQQEQGMKNRNR